MLLTPMHCEHPTHMQPFRVATGAKLPCQLTFFTSDFNKLAATRPSAPEPPTLVSVPTVVSIPAGASEDLAIFRGSLSASGSDTLLPLREGLNRGTWPGRLTPGRQLKTSFSASSPISLKASK